MNEAFDSRDPTPQSNQQTFILSESAIASRTIPSRIEQQIEFIYRSSLEDSDTIRRQLWEKQIFLGNIAQKTEIYLAAINAFCEYGTFGLPALPEPANFPGLPAGALVVAPEICPDIFEHLCLDTRFHRGETGPILEQQIRQMGLATVAPKFLDEYLSFLQNVSRSFVKEDQDLNTLTDFVAKEVALSIAINSPVLASTPSILQIANREDEIDHLHICLNVSTQQKPNENLYDQAISVESGDVVHVIAPGFNFLSEYRSLNALPHIRFCLYEEIPFNATILRKTAELLGMQNITVHDGLSDFKNVKEESAALILSPRTYTCSDRFIPNILSHSERALQKGGKLIILNVQETTEPFVPQNELDNELSHLTVENRQTIQHENQGGFGSDRSEMLQMDGKTLYQAILTKGNLSQAYDMQFIVARKG